MEQVARQLRRPDGALNLDTVREARELLANVGTTGDGTLENAAALNTLAAILEREDRRYQELSGDAYINQRSMYTIGRVLNLIKDDDDMYERIAWEYITHARHPWKVRIAALRLTRIFLYCTGAQYPLTEEMLVNELANWALQPHSESMQGDDSTRLRVYAMGMLAMALASDDAAGNLVRNGTMAPLLRGLRTMMPNVEGGATAPSGAAAVTAAGGLVGAGAGEGLEGTFTRSAGQASGSGGCGSSGSGAAAAATAEGVGVSTGTVVEGHVDDLPTLTQRMLLYRIQTVTAMGEYCECLTHVMQERGIDLQLAVLSLHEFPEYAPDPIVLTNALDMVHALLAHRKLATMFVERGGLALLLGLPRNTWTHAGVARCLYALSAVAVVIETCFIVDAETPRQLMAAAVANLQCATCDTARRYAGFFLAATFPYHAIRAAFDAADGPRILTNLLRHMASLGPSQSTTSKSVACQASHALRTYLRAQLVAHVAALEAARAARSERSGAAAAAVMAEMDAQTNATTTSSEHGRANRATHVSGGGGGGGGRSGSLSVDVSDRGMEATLKKLTGDKRLRVAFLTAPWPFMQLFVELDGLKVLLELAQAGPSERYFHDVARYALEALFVVTVHPAAQRAVMAARLHNSLPPMSVLLNMCSVHTMGMPSDFETVLEALRVLTNCVGAGALAMAERAAATTPAQRSSSRHSIVSVNAAGCDRGGAGAGVGTSGAGTGNATHDATEAALRTARESIRKANGMRTLLRLLFKGGVRPQAHLDAVTDGIRAMVCRVLLGLAQNPHILHTLQALQVGRRLSELLREPGLKWRAGVAGMGGDGHAAAAEFNTSAVELIVLCTGRTLQTVAAATDAAAPPFSKMERAAIAAATKIKFPQQQLLQLIHEHLAASGLTDAAAALEREVELHPPHVHAAPRLTALPDAGTGLLKGKGREAAQAEAARVRAESGSGGGGIPGTPARPKMSIALTNSAVSTPKRSFVTTASPATPGGAVAGAKRKVVGSPPKGGSAALGQNTPARSSERKVHRTAASSTPHASTTAMAGAGGEVPMAGVAAAVVGVSSAGQSVSTTPGRDKGGGGTPGERGGGGRGEKGERESGSGVASRLDSIMVAYLRHQHRQCPAPIATCPPFSLLEPHACKEPGLERNAPANVARRVAAREICVPGAHGGPHGQRLMKQYVFSRFRPGKACRDPEGLVFTTAAFVTRQFERLLIGGGRGGELRLFDPATGDMLALNDSSSDAVMKLQAQPQLPSTSGGGGGGGGGHSGGFGSRVLLAASSRSAVKLYDVDDFEAPHMLTFDGCRAGHFSHSGRQLLATIPAARKLQMYDVGAGVLLRELEDPQDDSTGRQRRAAYQEARWNPSDTLLLWGGALWDARVPQPVHRFELLSEGGACFHPCGNEAILNSEVWDIRTNKLLRSVPLLDGTELVFNGDASVLFASLRRGAQEDPCQMVQQERRRRHPMLSAFRTLSAGDYSEIATVPLDRCCIDLALEAGDARVAVVELDHAMDDMDSVVRMYDVGRTRPTDDDSDEDEDDEGPSEDESEGDDGSLAADSVDGSLDMLDRNRLPNLGGGGRGGRGGGWGGGADDGDDAAAQLRRRLAAVRNGGRPSFAQLLHQMHSDNDEDPEAHDSDSDLSALLSLSSGYTAMSDSFPEDDDDDDDDDDDGSHSDGSGSLGGNAYSSQYDASDPSSDGDEEDWEDGV